MDSSWDELLWAGTMFVKVSAASEGEFAVRSLSCVQLFVTPCPAVRQSLSFCPSLSPGVCSNSCQLIWWCHPTILSSVAPFSTCPQSFPSVRVFSNESALRIRWPKYWSFSFNVSPSNEHSGLISFRMEWLDLLAVQGTLNSLFQNHSSKASILWHSAFFIVQLSHPYMTTGKTIALTRQTFIDKVMSLLFNMLSRLVITFLPRSKLIIKEMQIKTTTKHYLTLVRMAIFKKSTNNKC